MENRTEFDLNKKIEIWKSKLSQKSNMTQDNINELGVIHIISNISSISSNIHE